MRHIGLIVMLRSLAALAILVASARLDGAVEAVSANVTKIVSDLRSHPDRAGLGDSITVDVKELSAALKQAGEEKRKLVLFLNGIPFQDIKSEMSMIGERHGRLHFALTRTEATRAAWASLLGKPRLLAAILGQPEGFRRKVSVNVGLEGGGPLTIENGDANKLDLVLILQWQFWVCLVLLTAVFVGFWWMARHTEMLRDSGPKPPENKLRPYCLAKMQMAVWFLLTLASFLFIWLVSGALDSIPGSVLALMGIGAGTALLVQVQDERKDSPLKRLLAERQELETLRQPTAEQQAQLTALDQQIAQLTPVSFNFLDDVLTDAVGISFHRYRMLIWTVVLGLILLVEVYRNLAMPTFSETLLGLMGISSGTYIGFMIPESHSSQQAT